MTLSFGSRVEPYIYFYFVISILSELGAKMVHVNIKRVLFMHSAWNTVLLYLYVEVKEHKNHNKIKNNLRNEQKSFG